MTIRDKLLLGFGLHILLAIILGFFAYKELRIITTKLTLVEVSDDITNNILEARRYEKNFLLYRDDNSLKEFKNYLDTLKRNIDNIKAEIINEIGRADYEVMKKGITEYEQLFDNLTINFKAQEELSNKVLLLGRNIEKRLGGEELKTFLFLRRHEKSLMLSKDQKDYETFVNFFASSAFFYNGEIRRYRILADKLFALYKREKDSVEKIRTKAREIQSITENLSKRERTAIGDVLRSSARILLFALLTVLVLGIVINIKLSKSIATPIKKLEEITKKIAAGDFSERLQIKGGDEIASLGASFNRMEEKLKTALASLEDTIRKLRQKQAQLVEAEKLASIGILAAGIAHEINNPLTSVLTFSNLMLEQTPEDDPRYERLKMMVNETDRARNIVRQLLSFARETPIRPEKININRPVAEIVDSLNAREAFRGLELEVNLSDSLPEIYADPAGIGQVVMNILLNAIHAITPPGSIGLSTRAAGNFIEIIFTDTGCGIPEESINKVFDPFFTTKDSDKGTGLGLAVSYGIIKKHGGSIDVESEPGRGSTFTVRLPLTGSGVVE